MNSLRSPPRAKINLLFFQDIIMLVMGILILVTLMLSLSLGGVSAAAEEEESANKARELREKLAQIENENRRAQEQTLAVATLPKRELLESQVEALRRETNAAATERARSEAVAAAAQRRIESNVEQRKRADDSQKEVAQLESTAAELRAQIAAARTNSALYIVPSADIQGAGREPVVFIVSADKIQMRRMNGASLEERDLTNGINATKPLLEKLDSQKDVVVFYFRPSGAKWFVPLRDMARAAGFEVGYDAVEESQELVFKHP